MTTPQNPPVALAVQWLRAISTWLLETDNDMKLPNGVLDVDPLDIANALEAAEAASKARESALAGAVIDAVLALEDAANWMQDYVNGLPVSAPPIEHYRLVANTSRAALTKEPDA